MRGVSVRIAQVKLKDEAKYVELSVEGFWTRVQLPPPPPLNTKHRQMGGIFLFKINNLSVAAA